MFFSRKKSHFLTKLLLLLVVVLIAGSVYAYVWVKNLTLEEVLKSNIIQQQVEGTIGNEKAELFSLLPRFLGFTKPMTYLFLFQNNTEMRPGGGFIGVYAVVRVEKGKTEILKVEGSEILDSGTPEDWKPTPPQPISQHLKVDRWYFRDANWSPDFALSAQKVLELYKGENGLLADEIDMVVAITPTVLEELLKLTGSVTIEGIKFTSENVTETLEYEVEYGYDDRGLAFHERKQIIHPFMLALLQTMKVEGLIYWQKYLELAVQLAEEKHILLYGQDEDLQKEMEEKKWAGRVKESEGDFILWADANLASLKTDHALERTLSYHITPQEDGSLLAKVEMEYVHNGKFDWRTSRYRTFTSIFVPLGSKFVESSGSMKQDRSDDPGIVVIGEEMDKQWFGTFIAIEPGETKKLSFSYTLPDGIVKDGSYTLIVQKQLGTIAHGLTLSLDFGKNILQAWPGEEQDEWGDSVYKLDTNLRTDKEFEINF